MPISCHFRDCKALLVTSRFDVSRARVSIKYVTFTVSERSSPVNYDDVGERSVHVVTPLVAVLAVVSTFVMALLAIAFITDAGTHFTSLL